MAGIGVLSLGCGPGAMAGGFAEESSEATSLAEDDSSIPGNPDDDDDDDEPSETETDTGDPEPNPEPPPVIGISQFDIEYDGADTLTVVRSGQGGLEIYRLVAGEWVHVDVSAVEPSPTHDWGRPAATRDALGSVHALTILADAEGYHPLIWREIGEDDMHLWIVDGGLAPTSVDAYGLLVTEDGYHSLQRRNEVPRPTWMNSANNLSVAGSGNHWFAVADQLGQTALGETIMLAVYPSSQLLSLRLYVGTEHVHTKILGSIPLEPPPAGPAASFNAELVVHWYGIEGGQLREAWIVDDEDWSQQPIAPVDELLEVVALTRPDGEPTIAWVEAAGPSGYRVEVAERRDGAWLSLASTQRIDGYRSIALALSPSERLAVCDLSEAGEMRCSEHEP